MYTVALGSGSLASGTGKGKLACVRPHAVATSVSIPAMQRNSTFAVESLRLGLTCLGLPRLGSLGRRNDVAAAASGRRPVAREG